MVVKKINPPDYQKKLALALFAVAATAAGLWMQYASIQHIMQHRPPLAVVSWWSAILFGAGLSITSSFKAYSARNETFAKMYLTPLSMLGTVSFAVLLSWLMSMVSPAVLASIHYQRCPQSVTERLLQGDKFWLDQVSECQAQAKPAQAEIITFASSPPPSRFVTLPAGNNPFPGTIAISVPPNCQHPPLYVQRLEQGLRDQGLPVQEVSDVSFHTNTAEERAQIQAIMQQPMPQVYINGRVIGHPSLEEVMQEVKTQGLVH